LRSIIQILNRLKILNLSHSQNLVKTPNLLSSSLEKLILEGCSSLVEVHQSIGHSTSLVFLNLEGCCSLKTLPESIGNVKSLETLNISVGEFRLPHARTGGVLIIAQWRVKHTDTIFYVVRQNCLHPRESPYY